jgi:hypothetical protein
VGVFDFNVHRYSKEGRVVGANEYRLVINNGEKMMERPPYSGKWYAEDGTLVKDDSAAIEAKRAQEKQIEAEKIAAAEKAKRDQLKAELRAEIEAEKKEAKHGSGTKA